MSEAAAQVCAVIAEDTVASAREAIRRTTPLADLLEVRLDYLRDFDFTDIASLKLLVEPKVLPVILTCRPVTEGGLQQIEDSVRLRLLVEGSRHFADYCDVEAAHYEEAALLSPDLSRVIVSYHNFVETPVDLDAIYNRLTALPAKIHKIVTRANTIADSLAIFKLLDRARDEGRRLIALAMGEPGLITRVLGPAAGGFLTYGTVAEGKQSAPGQPTCSELIDDYRIHKISRTTSITGIIGSPVVQSASPAMHNRAFGELDLDAVYLPFAVEDLAGFFSLMVSPATGELTWSLRGLSVTIPHKSAVIPFLDEIDSTSRKIGAVNTVVVRDGKLAGYNTDVQGAMEPLLKATKLEGAACGVIGAGGAARAVIYGLLEHGARVSVYARDPEKARPVCDLLGVAVSPIEGLTSSDARIVINTTPIGMRGHSEGSSPVPRAALRNRALAYDLVYNPVETQFLKDAATEGCKTINGLEMLVAQAALQFELWTNKKPPIEAMRQAAMAKIARNHSQGR
ncbi:MAG: shikimate dehydrogenase [Blastocatellia bacterium]